MRVTCPHCKQRHDVAHSEVLREAERLRQDARNGKVVASTNGNVLTPGDELGAALRTVAILRRGVGKKI